MTGDLRRYAAANARARVLLADLLGRSGLEALYGYASVEAIFEALSHTSYRGRLDRTRNDPLAARIADVGRVILALLPDPERAFVRLYLQRYEVANVKVVIRGLSLGLPTATLAASLLALPGIGSLELNLLLEAHDVRELADSLRGTAYDRPLHSALHRLESAGPFALEVALDLDYYERLWSAAATLHPVDAARARGLLGLLFDILNLSWIARYRDAVGLAPEETMNYTLREGRWLTLEMRRRLAEDRTLSWGTALAGTPYGALLAEVPPRSFDAASVGLWRLLASEVQRELTGYPFHIGVPLGLLLSQELEMRDLRVLLSAKEIGVPGGEILDHLASVRH